MLSIVCSSKSVLIVTIGCCCGEIESRGWGWGWWVVLGIGVVEVTVVRTSTPRTAKLLTEFVVAVACSFACSASSGLKGLAANTLTRAVNLDKGVHVSKTRAHRHKSRFGNWSLSRHCRGPPLGVSSTQRSVYRTQPMGGVVCVCVWCEVVFQLTSHALGGRP